MRRSTVATAAVMVALLVTAGCSGDEEGPDDGPGTAPSASSTPSDSTTSGTPSGDPTSSTPSAEPTVTPASGPQLAMDLATVSLPDGWELTEGQASFLATGTDPEVGSSSFIGLSQFPSLVSDPTPAELEKAALDDGSFRGRGEVQAPVVVDGVEMRHVTGSDGRSQVLLYIACVEGDLVTLKIEQNEDIPEDEREEVVASVLASFRWT